MGNHNRGYSMSNGNGPQPAEVKLPSSEVRGVRKTYRKGIVSFLLGIWLLHESTIFGILLDHPDASVYYPLCFVIAGASKQLNCPYIFWTFLFSLPILGVGFFLAGCYLLVVSLRRIWASDEFNVDS